jgi:hypothetical protein
MTRRRALSTIVLAILISGCSVPAPLVLDESIRPEEIDEVVVLPVIDARPTRFEHVQIARNVEDATVRFLRERGYFTLTADRFRERPSGPLDLHVAGPAELVPLAPEDTRYFMLVQVERLEPGVSDETGQAYDARLTGVLVDRERGRVIWRDVATASSHLSGVLTVFARGSRQYEAAVNASRALVETLPDKKTKTRKN